MDFDEESARKIKNIDVLKNLLSGTFSHRRKKITTIAEYKDFPFPAEQFLQALRLADIDPSTRPDQISPDAYRRIANELAKEPYHGN